MFTYKNITRNSCWMLIASFLCLVSCKQNLEMQTELDTRSVSIKPNVSAIATPEDGGSTSTTMETFAPGDKIGVFSQLKAEALGDRYLKSNSYYSYDTPNWTPATSADKLEYSDSGPIYIYAYHPFTSNIPGANTTIQGSTLTHRLLKDQGDQTKLKELDLLWASATNNSVGYVSQRDAIDLTFSHKLTKVSFYIRLIDSDPGTAPATESIFVDSVQVLGTDIHTQTTMNIASGVLSNIPKAVNDTIAWISTQTNGTPLKIVAKTDPATHIADMLLVPFVAQQGANKFRYILNFVGSNNEPIPNNFQTTIPVFDPLATQGASTLNFAENKHNHVVVTIDVSNGKVYLAATIKDWEQGPETDLEADRE